MFCWLVISGKLLYRLVGRNETTTYGLWPFSWVYCGLNVIYNQHHYLPVDVMEGDISDVFTCIF